MIDQKQKEKIKEAVQEFFQKMTIEVLSINIELPPIDNKFQNEADVELQKKDVVEVNLKVGEPQILIGQGGQTLFEIQRLLRMVINKKLPDVVYFNLDINDYKKNKIEYLKDLAKDLADQVSLNKEEKILAPMPAYERRVIHAELSQRTDIITESHGDGSDRHIVIKPN